MKLKDLPPKTNLGGIKVKAPNGQVGYWCSQWQKGVWLYESPKLTGRIIPVFVEDLKEAMEWEVLDPRYVQKPINKQ